MDRPVACCYLGGLLSWRQSMVLKRCAATIAIMIGDWCDQPLTNTSPSSHGSYLDREMDLFVLIMSILVPVSSPLIGIVVDTVHKRTKDSTKTLLTGCTVIYSALIAYSLAVFVNTNVGRWCSYSLLSIAKSFGLWGCTVCSSVSIPLSSVHPLTKSVQR